MVARAFWGTTGVAALLGGAALFVAVFAFRGEDCLVAAAGAIALVGLAGFSIYRGFWARRRGFWRRTLWPFLFISVCTAALIPVMLIVMFSPVVAVVVAGTAVTAFWVSRRLRRSAQPLPK